MPRSHEAVERSRCFFTLLCCVAAVAAGGSAAVAQNPAEFPGSPLAPAAKLRQLAASPVYVIPQPSQMSLLYADGQVIEINGEQRWRFMCGSDTTGLTVEDLANVAESHEALFVSQPSIIIDGQTRGSSLDVIYNLDASVPTEAVAAFAAVEAYLEAHFGDPISFTVACSFASMGGGVIGATGSQFVQDVTWNNSRNGLINGMDDDDTIQSFLPSGSSIPVRYDSSTATVTNETQVNWTRANYRATVGTVAGSAASMQFNTDFAFDYNPANGVLGSRTSFYDVLAHETGHAMGFVSAVDSQATSDFETLDIYRFQRTDGTGDYNPDTTAEFQTKSRLNDFGAPNDDHNFDIISVEYRLEDGNPWQASHWREQAAVIGQMDPAIGGGETHWPDLFETSDFTAFDAIGWDYPPCVGPTLTQQPAATQTICQGATAQLSVATGAAGPSYQWRVGTTNLTNGGRISGATSATLSISGFQSSDEASNYNCIVTGSNGCPTISNDAELLHAAPPVFNTQPASQLIPAGSNLFIFCAVTNPSQHSYRWYKNNVAMNDDARINGAFSQTLSIDPVLPSDGGDYFCRVTHNTTGCSGDSDTATITIDCSSNQVTQQPPASQTVCRGLSVQKSVVTSAFTPSYQWRKGVANLSNGGNVSGATSATLTISNVQPADAAADYNCVITDTSSGCVVTSNNSALVVDSSAAAFLAQPSGATLDVGDDFATSVSVQNPANYTYQWRRDGANLSNDARISGATSAALAIQGVVEGDEGDYDCVVTPIVGTCPVTSDAALLVVNAPPACVEDINGNGTVDLSDLSILLTNFGTASGAGAEDGDLDGDQDVDLSDLSMLLARFGAPC